MTRPRPTPTATATAQARAATSTSAPPPPVAAPRATGYEHLVALFVQRDALPARHPHRRRLREQLITGYSPVAHHIARKYSYRGDNPDDIGQVAMLGLILAVDRFEPSRGVDFLSFAVPTISGEVLRHFRDRATTIRVPRRLRALQALIYDTAAELAQRHGRAARPSEIAHALGMDIEEVLLGLHAQNLTHCSSLDEPIFGDDARAADCTRFGAALGQTEPEYDRIEHRHALAPLVAELPERERRILMLRFFAGMTQTEIADTIGISQMHVSRLLSRTLHRLRRKLATD